MNEIISLSEYLGPGRKKTFQKTVLYAVIINLQKAVKYFFQRG